MNLLARTILLIALLTLLYRCHEAEERALYDANNGVDNTANLASPMELTPMQRAPIEPIPMDSSLRPDTLAVQSRLGQPLEAESLRVAPVPPDSGLSHTFSLLPAPNVAPRKRASFSVKVRDTVIPYSVFGVFAMPGEKIDIEALFTQPSSVYKLIGDDGKSTLTEAGGWIWTAPKEPGVYRIAVAGPHDAVMLQVFVKTPYNNSSGKLEGYRIGNYQAKPLRNDPRFAPPKGLIRVTEENRDLYVSPHFTLGAFTSHQPGDPKFVLIDENLLLKLEMLLEEIRDRGIEAPTLTIMSAYRTPWYNKSIGNTTTYSLHLFGRAVDIFVDADRDGRMDDLNGNGREDTGDAKVLFDIVNDLGDETWYQPFIGGLGLYGPKPHRGPFIHVDVRGYRARW